MTEPFQHFLERVRLIAEEAPILTPAEIQARLNKAFDLLSLELDAWDER